MFTPDPEKWSPRPLWLYEDEAIVSVPDAARMTAFGTEPEVVVAVLHAEDVVAAAPIGDDLYCDTEPFAAGLVAVLQAQSGTDFGGAQPEAKLDRFGADVRVTRDALEAEVADRKHDEIEVDLFL